MSFTILGTGHYVPPRVVKNEELSQYVDTSDAWITQRVGIKERHVCTNETTTDLAYEAAMRALENSGTAPEELDMILCATVSGDYVTPSLACMVQNRIGATCPAMDINAACSAFLFLLDTAAGFFARKRVKKMLLVGAERMSRIVDWEDRSTCVIFGDGAGAVVLGEGDGYLAAKFHTHGGDEVIQVPCSNGKSPFCTRDAVFPYIYMNGAETYKFAVTSMSRDLNDVLQQAGLKGEEIAAVIPHQANARIIAAAKKQVSIPADRFYVNIDRYGNTSAASIPIALDELNRSGKLQRGDYLAMCAFGGGLAGAACILRW